MKNYRFYQADMESLGQRLDAARKVLSDAKTEWAQNYWNQVIDRLLIQWQQLPILHDGEAQTTIIPRWEVNYGSFEKHDSVSSNGLDEKFYNAVFNREPNLEWSWHKNREQRLARAQ